MHRSCKTIILVAWQMINTPHEQTLRDVASVLAWLAASNMTIDVFTNFGQQEPMCKSCRRSWQNTMKSSGRFWRGRVPNSRLSCFKQAVRLGFTNSYVSGILNSLEFTRLGAFEALFRCFEKPRALALACNAHYSSRKSSIKSPNNSNLTNE